jgi:hypothetical protein
MRLRWNTWKLPSIPKVWPASAPLTFRAQIFYQAPANCLWGDRTPVSGENWYRLVQDIYAFLSIIRNHEQAHVRVLSSTIPQPWRHPISAPRFSFRTTMSMNSSHWRDLENTGVAALQRRVADDF